MDASGGENNLSIWETVAAQDSEFKSAACRRSDTDADLTDDCEEASSAIAARAKRGEAQPHVLARGAAPLPAQRVERLSARASARSTAVASVRGGAVMSTRAAHLRAREPARLRAREAVRLRARGAARLRARGVAQIREGRRGDKQ
jgi:hypothetical protein